MLTRIGGTAFRTREELEEYNKLMEEAARRDHRRIGKEMNLFMLLRGGPGLPVLPAQGHGAQEHADRLLARDPLQG